MLLREWDFYFFYFTLEETLFFSLHIGENQFGNNLIDNKDIQWNSISKCHFWLKQECHFLHIHWRMECCTINFKLFKAMSWYFYCMIWRCKYVSTLRYWKNDEKNREKRVCLYLIHEIFYFDKECIILNKYIISIGILVFVVIDNINSEI